MDADANSTAREDSETVTIEIPREAYARLLNGAPPKPKRPKMVRAEEVERIAGRLACEVGDMLEALHWAALALRDADYIKPEAFATIVQRISREAFRTLDDGCEQLGACRMGTFDRVIS